MAIKVDWKNAWGHKGSLVWLSALYVVSTFMLRLIELKWRLQGKNPRDMVAQLEEFYPKRNEVWNVRNR